MYRYAVGLGSNVFAGRRGSPERIVAAALAHLDAERESEIVRSRPLGPSRRRFANAAAIVTSALPPPYFLARLKTIEREHGRRGGRRWGARILDLDILLWSGARWHSPTLTIPHPALMQREFALVPLHQIAPRWIIPGAGTVRQALARLTRPRPLHRARSRSGP
jgi:2-amino-4-hydroxy-6-hydroxymethyldihydropteridine diphosphokinase